MSVQTKKSRFFYLVAPAVEKVHAELMKEYLSVTKDIKEKKNTNKIMQLKAKYNVVTNDQLLASLKPHPQSIVLAQAALESSWATSRFFVQANNIFGMHSINPKEPRIAASKKRGGTRTVWLRKFDSIEDSVKAYYKLMARGKAFREFRVLRLKTNDPHQLVKKLDNYSEIGDDYAKELSQVIRHNKLRRFDK
jgi:Bax protein